jgi:hypothetical protein
MKDYCKNDKVLLFLIPLLSLLLFFLARGYLFNVKDQTVFLPYLQHTLLNVPFSPYDDLIKNIHGVSTIHLFLAPIFKWLPSSLKTCVSLEWMIFISFLITNYIIFWSVFYITRKITGSNSAAFLACLLVSLISPKDSLLFAVTQNYLISVTLAMALTLSALAAIMAGKPLTGCALAGFSTNCNPTIALPLIVATSAYLLISAKKAKKPYFIPLLGILGMIILSIPWVVSILSSNFYVHPINPSQEWFEVLDTRFYRHDVKHWSLMAWLGLMMPFSILFTAAGHKTALPERIQRIIFVLFSVCSVMIFLHILVTFIRPLPIIVQLQLMRSYPYILLLSCIGLSYLLFIIDKEGPVRCALAAMLFFLALFGVFSYAILLSLVLLVFRKKPGRDIRLLSAFTLLAVLAFFLLKPEFLDFDTSYVPSVYLWFLFPFIFTLFFALHHIFGRTNYLLRVVTVLGVITLLLIPLFSWRKAARRGDSIGDFCRRRYRLPGLRHKTPFEQCAIWAKENTPEDAVFLVGFQSRGFRGFSNRSPFFLFKDGCFAIFDERYAAQWLARRQRWSGVTIKKKGDGITVSEGSRSRIPSFVSYGVLSRKGLDAKELTSATLYANDVFQVVPISDIEVYFIED